MTYPPNSPLTVTIICGSSAARCPIPVKFHNPLRGTPNPVGVLLNVSLLTSTRHDRRGELSAEDVNGCIGTKHQCRAVYRPHGLGSVIKGYCYRIVSVLIGTTDIVRLCGNRFGSGYTYRKAFRKMAILTQHSSSRGDLGAIIFEVRHNYRKQFPVNCLQIVGSGDIFPTNACRVSTAGDDQGNG